MGELAGFGPWTLEDGANSHVFDGRIIDRLGNIIGFANLDDPAAAVMIAAPELLEALSWFINDIDGTHTVMVEFDAAVLRARDAIAKALNPLPNPVGGGD